MFTKNLNLKVNCSFQFESGSLIAPDSITANKMLDFIRYKFDLSEDSILINYVKKSTRRKELFLT
jgi:hypothetical protein